MGGMQANSQGKYEAKLAKRNAGMEIEAAHDSVLQGQDEAREYWRGVARTKGQNIASMAANGIDVDFGSAARLQDDTQLLADEDAKKLYRNIEERTRGHVITASNYVEEAKAAKARGKAALVGSLFQGASSLIGGASQAMGLKAKMGTSTARNG